MPVFFFLNCFDSHVTITMCTGHNMTVTSHYMHTICTDQISRCWHLELIVVTICLESGVTGTRTLLLCNLSNSGLDCWASSQQPVCLIRNLSWWPATAVANCHKHTGWKQHRFVILPCWIPEGQNQDPVSGDGVTVFKVLAWQIWRPKFNPCNLCLKTILGEMVYARTLARQRQVDSWDSLTS